MSKLIQLNENFSHTPRAKVALVDEKTCTCTDGVLYVMTANSKGIAAGKGARVVATLDGAIAEQAHPQGQIFAMTDKAVLQLLPAPERPAPVNTGASRATGSNNKSAVSDMLNQRLNRQ